MVNQIYAKILKYFIFLRPRLSETFSFSLCIFDNDSSFWKYQYSRLKTRLYRKNTASQSWKPSDDAFWPKPNRKKQCSQKTVPYKIFVQCTHIIFALKLWKRLWISNRDQNIEVCRRLGWVTKWVYSDSRAQNSWDRGEKLNKVGQNE